MLTTLLMAALQLASTGAADERVMVTVAVVKELEFDNTVAVIVRRSEGPDLILVTREASSNDLADALAAYTREYKQHGGRAANSRRIPVKAVIRSTTARNAQGPLANRLKAARSELVPGLGNVPVMRVWVNVN
ncbi:MAG: hypothetical protein ACRENP_22445 [Longimicrobiales bacterium]